MKTNSEPSLPVFPPPAEAHSSERLGLEQEIDLLRAAVRRLFEIGLDSSDNAEAVRALRAMATAAGRLAVLLRTCADLGRAGKDEPDMLARALQEIAIELQREGLDEP